MHTFGTTTIIGDTRQDEVNYSRIVRCTRIYIYGSCSVGYLAGIKPARVLMYLLLLSCLCSNQDIMGECVNGNDATVVSVTWKRTWPAVALTC